MSNRIEVYLHWCSNCELGPEWKPILRPLSSMTPEENAEYLRERIRFYVPDAAALMRREAAGTKYLLSKHFDIFGLIASGDAIDKTKTV